MSDETDLLWAEEYFYDTTEVRNDPKLQRFVPENYLERLTTRRSWYRYDDQIFPKLSSQDAIAADFQVSRITVQEALRQLEVDEPLALTVYPGADGSFNLYEDDGASFNYRRGEWTGIEMR